MFVSAAAAQWGVPASDLRTPPLAPAFANAIAALTGKTPRELPFKLT
jgi:CO/xanthine dehydrogenase Mo-binding subunit